MDQAEAERRVGTTLKGKWTLERLLGVGGMAAVYACSHKIGRRDAIKILHPEVACIPDLRSRFELEAHVANRFKHPGAVEIRDIDASDDGCPFLVMELLEGESLGEKARRGPVALAELLGWIDELCDVLAAAHAMGIVHRDVKLDNLFVTREGKLKVLDFGIARVRSGSGMASGGRTQIGATLGTAPYMPPEQVRGGEVDGRADIFAVGATMFRLIARRRIHDAPTEAEIMAKMGTEPAPALGSVARSAPADVCLVVDRALRFEREERYPDAATMREDVRALRAGLPPPYATAMRRAGDAAISSKKVPSSEVPTPVARPFDGPTRIEQSATLTAVKVADLAPRRAPPPSVAVTRVDEDEPPSTAPDPATLVAAPAGSALIGSTLKSAAVVALPAEAPPSISDVRPLIPAPPSRPFVVAPAARRGLSQRDLVSLVIFGGAFIVLGIVLALWIARPSSSGHAGEATPSGDEEPEPRHASPAHNSHPLAPHEPVARDLSLTAQPPPSPQPPQPAPPPQPPGAAGPPKNQHPAGAPKPPKGRKD